ARLLVPQGPPDTQPATEPGDQSDRDPVDCLLPGDGAAVGLLYPHAPGLGAQGLATQGPEQAEEAVDEDDHQDGQQWVAVQCAGVGHRLQGFATVDHAQDALLVHQDEHHQQCQYQQQVVEVAGQAAEQAGSGEIPCG